jgi:hypothetical protein
MSDSVSEQDTPSALYLWMMERLYEQTLAFIILCIIFLSTPALFNPQELLHFVQWIIILFAGQLTLVFSLQKFPILINDETKLKEIFSKMIRFGLPLVFLLFLAIMVGQLFSEAGIAVISGRNINVIDLLISGLGILAFILILLIKKDWT